MSDYLEISHLLDNVLYWNSSLDVCIRNLATPQTEYMIVVADVSIKALLRARDFESLYDTVSGQKLKVSIDGTHADAGESPPNHIIKLIGAWVASDFAEFFQNDTALLGLP
jgi:hypothetical protein